jgi:GrpB-like predicted nucleotidyltransferase (UPF0157 family)
MDHARLGIEAAQQGRLSGRLTPPLTSSVVGAMITIAPYNPAWPEMFYAEAANIRRVLGELVLRVEHVGSTAVPGLAAKPVIDLQISVASLEPMGIYVQSLASIGYSHIPLGEFDSVYPFFQSQPSGQPHTTSISV